MPTAPRLPKRPSLPLDRHTQQEIASYPDRLKSIMDSYLNTPTADALRSGSDDPAHFKENLRLYELNLRFVHAQLQRLLKEIDDQLAVISKAKQALAVNQKISRP